MKASDDIPFVFVCVFALCVPYAVVARDTAGTPDEQILSAFNSVLDRYRNGSIQIDGFLEEMSGYDAFDYPYLRYLTYRTVFVRSDKIAIGKMLIAGMNECSLSPAERAVPLGKMDKVHNRYINSPDEELLRQLCDLASAASDEDISKAMRIADRQCLLILKVCRKAPGVGEAKTELKEDDYIVVLKGSEYAFLKEIAIDKLYYLATAKSVKVLTKELDNTTVIDLFPTVLAGEKAAQILGRLGVKDEIIEEGKMRREKKRQREAAERHEIEARRMLEKFAQNKKLLDGGGADLGKAAGKGTTDTAILRRNGEDTTGHAPKGPDWVVVAVASAIIMLGVLALLTLRRIRKGSRKK